MKPFSGIHDLSERDTMRDWSKSEVRTTWFNVDEQPVTAFQNPWELAQLLEVYISKNPFHVLELGPYHGGVLWHWMRLAGEGTVIGAVDFFDTMLGPLQSGPVEWQDWTPGHCKFQFFNGDTRDPAIVKAVDEYFEGWLDWLFIDANHDYDFVRTDLENYGSMVKPGGVIVFHDIRPRDLGSYELFTEMQRAGYVTQELVADPKATEAGAGIVYL